MAVLQFDYESILNRLTEGLSTRIGGTLPGGSTAQRILEVVAEKLAQTVRYAEYLTRETKWSLAQNSSSILTQLELFGYTPHRKVGSSGYIRVSTDPSFSSTYPNNIKIPKFSQFSNGELTFCCSKDDIELISSAPYVDVPVIQGSLSTLQFSGSDINNYRYQMMNNSIENSLYDLTQNSIQMVEVDSFGDSQISYNGIQGASQAGGEYEFRVRNIQGFEGIELQFPSGDEYTSSDQFVFRYLITEGNEGNVTASNSVTTVLGTFTDSQGITVQLYCTNVSVLTGGSDYETIDEMKENAPLSFNRVDKYITKSDYRRAISSVFTGSNVFYLWTEQEANEQSTQFNDSYDFYNNSKIFICGCTYDEVTRTLTPWNGTDQLSILNSSEMIQSHKGLTDYFVIEEPAIIYFYLNGTVYFDRTLTDASLTRAAVANMLTSTYTADTTEFFKSVYHSDYISDFRDMDEIDHVDVDINLYMLLDFAGVQDPTTGAWSEGLGTLELQNFGFPSSESNRYYITLYDSISRLFVEDLV